MTRAGIAGGAFAAVLVVLALVAVDRVIEHDADPAVAIPPAIAPSTMPAPAETPPTADALAEFLYGRITTTDGAAYEGRLRWGKGGDQEAFWGDYFNGVKYDNPWIAEVPPEERPKERHPIEIFGLKIAEQEKPLDVRRPLVARFGEITRIESSGRNVKVTLKSGTLFDLDRFEASDFDDGVRVWDATRGVVDLDSLQVHSIDLLPAPSPGTPPTRSYGTVRTRLGEFTGFVEWGRKACVGTDELDGRTAEGPLSLRFDGIRSIARRSRDGSLVTLADGREIALSGSPDVGRGNRGIHVDDRRYGRVSISWDAFERVDFAPGGTGPAYDDFPPGRPLSGRVTTRADAVLAGRLVYDLDESETIETLDAASEGVDYTIPFGLVASIVPAGGEGPGTQHASVTLHSGEELQLERTGDLGPQNAGILIFAEGRERPDYVAWADVKQVDFDRPPSMYPPLDAR
jgi:hypothetical protein